MSKPVYAQSLEEGQIDFLEALGVIAVATAVIVWITKPH